jgi:hypothetical protein
MNTSLFYISGEEVHAGDRVQFDTNYGTIVFVSDGTNEEFSPGYEDHTGAEQSVVFCDDDGNLTTLVAPDERLAFLDRG